jgi:hypothetical protein
VQPRLELRAGLRAPSQSRVQTCVRTCASRVRTCVRLCAGQILHPHPPSGPFGWALSRMEDAEGRNETPSLEVGYLILAPEGVHATEEFFQAGEG